MNTLKEYYDDMYRKTCTATVLAVKDDCVVLDRTIFYPECGGQPGDRGTFGPWTVTDTTKDAEETIYHHIKDFDGKIGATYTLTLDWEHRYTYMKVHAAQHMLSGLLYHHFDVATLSVHQGRKLLTIEIDRATFDPSQCLRLEALAQKTIGENHRIHFEVMDKAQAEKLGMRRSVKVDSDVRIVIIDGVDTIACGGVHCYNTGEIGLLFYAGQEMIRGHVRLQFVVGEEVRHVFHRRDALIKDLCVLHSAQEETLAEKERIALEKSQMAERKVQALEQSLAQLYLKSNSHSAVTALDVTDSHIDFKVFSQVVTGENKALLLIQRDHDFMRWLVYLSGCYGTYRLQDFKSQLLVLVDGKGGGKPPVWQGKGNAQQSKEFMQAFVTTFTELVQHE